MGAYLLVKVQYGVGVDSALKAIAEKNEMRYQTMLRSWISEKIREELAKDPRRLKGTR